MKATVILMLEGTVKADQRDAFEAFLREARPHYESIGDVTMRVMWRDECHFREIFEYNTEAAYHADDERVTSDPVMAGYLTRWRSFLESGPDVSVWREMDFGET
ncbi:MAG: hypothetical protein M9934_11355 [Thermomicrobiales bacterium]|nr:hypothetical protein [Thermomicrobiales bacterium]